MLVQMMGCTQLMMILSAVSYTHTFIHTVHHLSHLPPPPPPLPITLSPHIAVRLCPNSLGTVVENGDMTYTPGLRDDVGYVAGTTASVECRSGYEIEGENAVCREDGTWSSALANCSEGNVKTPTPAHTHPHTSLSLSPIQ